MKKLMMAFFVVFTLQACTKDLSLIKQEDTKWELAKWPGKTLPTTAKATLNITGGNKIGGKSFCNTYGGNAVINGNAIQFSKIFGTQMYCEPVGDAEKKYYADLEKVTAGKVSGSKLFLYQNETLLLVFSKVE
ncbi:META domain-containing protein [Pedobacter chitinilyticus]|uniref:META domain-containing protein n=1 Tax=Pedobacter chitinilyticus TaxID=2233776 RepID=A0A3S3SQ69_9SPHI|nr:META domain-containing protein [Pedobacter chitinilyticus]RWU05424.1 META domain-containing protein [Pedobacter chitinilyticus]